MKKEENIVKDFGSIEVPSKWDDINLEKYQRIEKFYEDKDKEFNMIDVLDILIDKDRDYIIGLPSEFIDIIFAHLMFLQTPPNFGKSTNKIEIDNEVYSINVQEKLRVGEYVAVDSVIKADKHNYAAILAILCRKNNELYDSTFENEVLEERIKMFERQPITKVMPLIAFFMDCYILLETPTQISLQIREVISHIRSNIETSVKNGEVSKRCMKSQMKKLKKLEKSINSI